MTKEWKDGLPPVGVEVEFDSGSHGWRKCIVKAIGDKRLIYQQVGVNDEECLYIFQMQFRPIKSPQEIERDKAIEEMLDVDMSESENVCEALYDAGYERLGEAPTLNDLSEKMHGYVFSLASGRELLKHFKIYPRGE